MSIIKGTNQIIAGFGGTKRSIGEVYFSQSALATDNSGALPLFTGETIASANTIYPEFYNWVLAHTGLQCTSAEYEAALSTYGECAKYVIGSGSLRLPLIKNYIKAANPSEGITQKGAGLPNITGYLASIDTGGRWGLIANASANDYNKNSGAFRAQNNGPYTQSVSTGKGVASGDLTFDASKSNAIYGGADTVQPAHTTLYPWVVAYTAAIPASTAQAAEFQQGLSGKADTNLGNLSAAGKDLASGLGMPSNRYIDLTLGASGSSYTAPANGYVFFSKVCSANGQWAYIQGGITVGGFQGYNNNGYKLFIPVKKNETFKIDYNLGGTTETFRLIYAEGAE